ncbi:replication protein A 32 kDa subunit B-like isoform X2 [Tasmannia lanceolata]|uniref:replication protein A 32 kDa subunit B-like isoform X2 n=1 Tax=Tasmannia lanceolata TaxID=3420 RepID=UPI00406381CB
MFASQFDGASLFSGGGFMPSQATQNGDVGFSSAKSRSNQSLLPLTVKQISEAYQSGEEKSFVIDGIEVNNVSLLGMVMNKMEKVTDVSFNLDDGTGWIEVHRWMNDSAESNEVAVIQNGMYVRVNGHLKSFQGKKHVAAFSVRPVTDFDEIAYHFIECIHVHLYNKKLQGGSTAQPQINSAMTSPYQNGSTGFQSAVSNQFATNVSVEKSSDFDQLILETFLQPKALADECGLHVNDVAQQLGVPINKVMESINYHIDMGNIYSTIDDNHFKSARNG